MVSRRGLNAILASAAPRSLWITSLTAGNAPLASPDSARRGACGHGLFRRQLSEDRRRGQLEPPLSELFHSTKNALSEQPQVVLPFRRVVGIAVYMPDMRHLLISQVSMHALANADQAILLPAGDPQQFQLVLGRGRIGNQLGRRLGVGRRG